MTARILHISARALSVAWTTVNLLVMAAFLLSAYGGWIDPRRFALLQLANMSFPLWIIAAVALLIVNLVVRRRRLCLAWCAALIASWGPIVTVCPVNVTSSSEDSVAADDEFTLLTYNVFGMIDYGSPRREWSRRTMHTLIEDDATIVCLQETPNLFYNGIQELSEQADTLRQMYPYSSERSRGDFVMSKFAMDQLPVDMPDWKSCSISVYRVYIGSRELIVVDCHLQSIGLTDADKELYRDLTTGRDITTPTREELSKVKHDILGKLLSAFRMHAEQADFLVDYLARFPDANVIVAGDFNDVQGSYVYRMLRSRCGLKDAWQECGFGPMPTYNANRLYFHIDHVLYRGDITPVSVRIGRQRSSDHYPVLARFRFTE